MKVLAGLLDNGLRIVREDEPALSEEVCIRHLDQFGIDTSDLQVNNGRVLRLKSGEAIDGTYLNRNRAGLLYFTMSRSSAAQIDELLWRFKEAEEVKKKDRTKANIYPSPGREREALIQLFGDNMEQPEATPLS